MAMTSMSVIFAVFILHIHHRGNLNKRAPPWLRKISHIMARLVCVKTSPVLHNDIMSELESRNNAGAYNKGFRINSLRRVTLSPLSKKGSHKYYIHQQNSRGAELTYRLKHVEDDVLRNLRLVVGKHEQEEIQHYLSKEWEDIAIVFDRFLFWIFFITACSATLALLVLKPLTKDITIDPSQFN